MSINITVSRLVALAFIGLALTLFVLIAKDPKRLLLKVIVLAVPFNIGFLYNPIIRSDLITLVDILLIGVMIIWLLQSGTQGRRISFPKASLPALLLIGWSALSALASLFRLVSGFEVIWHIKLYLIFLCMANLIKHKKDVQHVVICLLLGLFLESLFSLSQYFTGRRLVGRLFGEYFVAGSLEELRRVGGTIGHANDLGAYLAFLLPLPISLFLLWKRRSYRISNAALVVLASTAFIVAFSRGGWAGFLFSMVIFLFIGVKNGVLRLRSFLTLAIFGTLIAAGVILSFSRQILLRLTATSGYRIYLMQIAFGIIKANLLLGVGFRNYVFYSYPIFEYQQPVHNSYLRIAAELGIPGLVFFLWFFAAALREGFSAIKGRDTFLSATALGVLIGFFGILGTMMFGPEYRIRPIMMLCWILAGLLVTLNRLNRPPQRALVNSRASGLPTRVQELTKLSI